MKINGRSRKLYEELTVELQNFPGGSRFYSIREIMARHRSSQRLVETALLKMEKERLIRREPRIGIFSNLSNTERKKQILFLLPDWPSNHLKGLGRSIAEAVKARNWIISMRTYDPESDEYRRQPLGEIDALICYCPGRSLGRAEADWLFACQERVPVVMLGKHPGDFALNCVCAKDIFSGYEALRYLYGLGHRRILVMLSEPQNCGVKNRHAGAEFFARVHSDIRLEYLDCRTESGESAMQRNYEEIMRRCRRKIDFSAIYADSSDSVAGTYKAFYETGIRIPEDISIISNDILTEGLFHTPPLSMIGMCSA